MSEEERELWRAIGAGLEEVKHKSGQDLENRLALLWIHACVAAFVGVTMLVDGPSPAYEYLIGYKAAQLVMGIPPLVAGFALACGLILRRKTPYALLIETVALTMLLLWNAALVYGLAKQLIEAPPGVITRWFGVGIYGGYIGMLGVHLWTLVRRAGLSGRGPMAARYQHQSRRSP